MKMKKVFTKKVFAFALFALISSANAGSYREAAENQRVCGIVGEVAGMTYVYRQKGLTYEQATGNIEGAPTPGGTDKASLSYLASDSGFSEHVHSAQDAYMRGWAECMDRMSR